MVLASCQRECGDKSRTRTLATVDDTPITEAELQLAIDETLAKDTGNVSPAARRKLLESLVATRAIALVAQKELSAAKLAEIERKVDAYRDDQLAKQYLEKHAPPEPVTDAMVEAYYREHLEELGAHVIRSYELLSTEQESAGAARTALIESFANAERETDWSKVASTLTKSGHAVRYDNGQLPAASVDPQIAGVIEGLKPGETSKPFFVRGLARAGWRCALSCVLAGDQLIGHARAPALDRAVRMQATAVLHADRELHPRRPRMRPQQTSSEVCRTHPRRLLPMRLLSYPRRSSLRGLGLLPILTSSFAEEVVTRLQSKLRTVRTPSSSAERVSSARKNGLQLA